MLIMMFVCFLFCRLLCVFLFFFFFQAEDGIRDHCVTGVQTCALPILTLRQRLRNAARVAKYDVPLSKYFHVRDGLLEISDLSALSDRAITYSFLDRKSVV